MADTQPHDDGEPSSGTNEKHSRSDSTDAKLPDDFGPDDFGPGGFENVDYGAAFADVYDRWYLDITPLQPTLELLASMSGPDPVLELGVGTGRIAIPLAERIAPIPVSGIDSSGDMLAELERKPGADSLRIRRGDMVDELPDGPFSLVFVAYNSLFNLTDADDQQRCFQSVAHVLADGGRFVVEAFVPDEPFRDGDDIALRSMTVTDVVLSVTRYDASNQRAEGQFIELRDGVAPRLRPWTIRYATVEQLDAMATKAGLFVEHRWEDVERRRFTDDSARHVTVYRKQAMAAPTDGPVE